MSLFNCNCKFNCTLAAVIASVVIGVVAAFLRVTAVITVAPAFYWATLGIAAIYLLGALITSVLVRRTNKCCICPAVSALLAGVLGTALFSAVLLAVDIAATGIISAILTGLLLFFLALIFTGTACLVKCLAGCDE